MKTTLLWVVFLYNLFMFKRKYNLALSPLVWAKYRSIINIDNIESLSSFKIKKIFKCEDIEAKEWYIHRVVSQWFNIQEKNLSRETMYRLKKIIKKTKMNLNKVEKHEILKIEERIFSTERTLKNLDTNWKLSKHEILVAKFNRVQLYKIEKEEVTLKLTNKKQFWSEEDILKEKNAGSLSISNKSFIIESNNKIKEIKFEEIESYSHEKHGFQFNKKNETFVLRAHDQVTLNNTIDLIFRKKAKNVIGKRKNS